MYANGVNDENNDFMRNIILLLLYNINRNETARKTHH